jgi:tetratricopeptide (TPR) repeat protein
MLPDTVAAREALEHGDDPAQVAAAFPSYPGAWAALADRAFAAGEIIESYAYARTGYHRGLDALRRAGWKGHGPVPWSHEPNRGFLRCVHALGRAARAIGESDEAARCAELLADSDPAAVEALA